MTVWSGHLPLSWLARSSNNHMPPQVRCRMVSFDTVITGGLSVISGYLLTMVGRAVATLLTSPLLYFAVKQLRLPS